MKRFALLDASGVCVNVVQYELPWKATYAIPGVRYVVPLEECDLPAELGRDWQWFPAQGRVGPGDTVDLKTGAVTYKTPPVAPPPTKDELLAYAANRRWEIEVGGCVWDGSPVTTDRDSTARIMGEFIAIMAGIRQDGGNWKFADGTFRQLTNAQSTQLGLTVRAHVANTFKKEAAIQAAIAAETITTYSQIEDAFK